MELSRYNDFIIENLLTEANVSYSSDFKDILRKIKSHVAANLLALAGRSVDIQQNYIDICPDKDDTITFIPDNKVTPADFVKYEIVDRNYAMPTIDKIFRILYKETGDESLNVDRVNTPPIGTTGTIRRIIPLELMHAQYGHRRPVVWFTSDNGQHAFFDMRNSDDYSHFGLRQIRFPVGMKGSEFKVGRYAKRLLTTAGIEVLDKDIEVFVNQYKSEIAKSKDIFKHFKVVEGEDIRRYYHESKYYNNYGTLGGSCMRYSKCQNFLDIYVQNPDKCKLLVLFSDIDPHVIIGRALLWTLEDGSIFMDRIYFNKDSLINVFKDYAISKGWKYKKDQNHLANSKVMVSEDKEAPSQKLEVKVKGPTYRFYPYMDTIKFLDRQGDVIIITNYKGKFILEQLDGSGGDDACRRCRGTRRVQCQTCRGQGEIRCYECDGSGNFTCPTCDGDGIIRGITGEVSCPKCSGNAEIRCPQCHGRGNYECGDCDGNGEYRCPDCS